MHEVLNQNHFCIFWNISYKALLTSLVKVSFKNDPFQSSSNKFTLEPWCFYFTQTLVSNYSRCVLFMSNEESSHKALLAALLESQGGFLKKF